MLFRANAVVFGANTVVFGANSGVCWENTVTLLFLFTWDNLVGSGRHWRETREGDMGGRNGRGQSAEN